MIDENDKAFRQGVEACDWPAGSFGHKDHIRLAWIYLQEHPVAVATDRCRETLSRFAAVHGDHEKYHDTLTVAFMKLIAQHVAETPPDESWEEFRARVRPLFESARELIAAHYSPDRLGDPAARAGYLPPDRKPL